MLNNHRGFFGRFALMLSLLAAPVLAENIDPDHDGAQYAWGENTGWINAEPSGDGGMGVHVSDFELSGWLWSESFGWISLSCQNTSSCDAVSYGVTNDGHGVLGGFAWAENLGWINFGPDAGGVSIDPDTGAFVGQAWAESGGWISLCCADTGSCGSVNYGVKTDWCQSMNAVTGTPDIRVDPAGSDVELSRLILADGTAWHEIIRGKLSTLASGGGDYASSMDGCVADDVTTSSAVVSGTPDTAAGDGYWYLVRRANCKGKGTFDSGGAGQAGSRDGGIAATGNECP